MAEVVSPRRADTHPLANGGGLTEEESSAFECNICYEIAQSPVVTLCGHLYCWPCLYRCARGAAVPSLCESCACWQSCARALFALLNRSECAQVDAGAEPLPRVPCVQGRHRAGQGTSPVGPLSRYVSDLARLPLRSPGRQRRLVACRWCQYTGAGGKARTRGRKCKPPRRTMRRTRPPCRGDLPASGWSPCRCGWCLLSTPCLEVTGAPQGQRTDAPGGAVRAADAADAAWHW